MTVAARSESLKTGLTVRGLTAGYGVMQVVHDVDIDVHPGELVCLIGRNGAGKTTTVKAISGIRGGKGKGSVLVGDHEVGRGSASEVVSRGLGLVPEGHRVFKELTVNENLRVGGFLRRHNRREVEEAIERVNDLFPVLAKYRNRPAGHLSGGEQQMVAIGQALVGNPRVLLLDEPSSGLALVLVAAIYEALSKLRSDGLAVLVVEQNVQRAFKHSDRLYLMESGRMVMSGPTGELEQDPRVLSIVSGLESGR